MASNRWFILAVLFLARISMGFHFQSVASVSPFLIDELAIDRPVRPSTRAGKCGHCWPTPAKPGQ